MNQQTAQIILKQYLTEFPQDSNEELEPLEIQNKRDKVVLIAKSYDGYRLIGFKNTRDGFVKFDKSKFCSGYEEALGDSINFLNEEFVMINQIYTLIYKYGSGHTYVQNSLNLNTLIELFKEYAEEVDEEINPTFYESINHKIKDVVKVFQEPECVSYNFDNGDVLTFWCNFLF